MNAQRPHFDTDIEREDKEDDDAKCSFPQNTEA